MPSHNSNRSNNNQKYKTYINTFYKTRKNTSKNGNQTSKNKKKKSRSEINRILIKLNKDVMKGKNFSKYEKYLETEDYKSSPYYESLKQKISHYYQTDKKYRNMVDKFVSSSVTLSSRRKTSSSSRDRTGGNMADAAKTLLTIIFGIIKLMDVDEQGLNSHDRFWLPEGSSRGVFGTIYDENGNVDPIANLFDTNNPWHSNN